MPIKKRSDYPATHLLKKENRKIKRKKKSLGFFSQGAVKAAET